MILYNPYTHRHLDYPLDLSRNNIVIDYYIRHETFFCPWFTTWLVIELNNGDMIYLPYGEQNRRDVYIVTSYYLNKEIEYPYGVYTMKYNEFFKENEINIPNDVYDEGDDDDDDFLNDLDIIKNITQNY